MKRLVPFLATLLILTGCTENTKLDAEKEKAQNIQKQTEELKNKQNEVKTKGEEEIIKHLTPMDVLKNDTVDIYWLPKDNTYEDGQEEYVIELDIVNKQTYDLTLDLVEFKLNDKVVDKANIKVFSEIKGASAKYPTVGYSTITISNKDKSLKIGENFNAVVKISLKSEYDEISEELTLPLDFSKLDK